MASHLDLSLRLLAPAVIAPAHQTAAVGERLSGGVAFALRDPEDGSRCASFDLARAGLTVAGMMRHVARRAAEQAGWAPERIGGFVLGHGEERGASQHISVGARRFAYLPLPSIEPRGPGRIAVGHIRRVLVATLSMGNEAELAWARRALPGQEMIAAGREQSVALLTLLPETDGVVRQYRDRAAWWASVTPVLLPGHDDRAGYRRRLATVTDAAEQRRLLGLLNARIERLLRKAIRQAGYAEELAEHAELEWSQAGFWPGLEVASRYGVHDHLKSYPRFHVKVGWRDGRGARVRIPGPVCIGAGRYLGLGLFARLADGDSG